MESSYNLNCLAFIGNDNKTQLECRLTAKSLSKTIIIILYKDTENNSYEILQPQTSLKQKTQQSNVQTSKIIDFNNLSIMLMYEHFYKLQVNNSTATE